MVRGLPSDLAMTRVHRHCERALSHEAEGRGGKQSRRPWWRRRFRHCERSEAIQKAGGISGPWIATACGLAMTDGAGPPFGSRDDAGSSSLRARLEPRGRRPWWRRGFRHCERSEAIQKAGGISGSWIATACGLAMTEGAGPPFGPRDDVW